MARKHRAWAVAACAVMVMGVTGCGGDEDKGGDKPTGGVKTPAGNGVEKLTAQEIADKAKAELKGAKSLHVTQSTVEDGEKTKIDLTLDSTGNCAGSFSAGSMGSFEIIKLGDKVWMKPDEAFWKANLGTQGAGAAELFKGRWLHGTTSDDMMKDMAGICELADLQSDMTGSMWPATGLTKGGTTTVNGQKVVSVKGKHAGGNTITVYVATVGKPHPLKMEQIGGTDPGSASFSDFGKPVPTKTPTKAESMDVSKLEQLGA